MSGETEEHVSGWTVDTLREYLDERALWQERLRVAEKAALERALQIKEQADRDALELARQIQTYKDEKANDLRSQIERERGTYVTQAELRGAADKIEATLAPLVSFMAAQQGSTAGRTDLRVAIYGAAGFVSTVIAIVFALSQRH